jgi:hypothetical protein
MKTEDAAPNQLTRQDAAALIDLLAILEGELLEGEVSDELLGKLATRLRDQGQIRADLYDRAGLRLALNDLNQRVRYALGEYEDPPEPGDGLAHHFVGFDTETDANRFREAMTALGLQPVQVPSDDESGPVQLMVTSGEVLLSRGFELRDKQIQDTAHEAGGRYIGWGGAPPAPL